MNDYFAWNSYYIHKRVIGEGSCSKVYYGIHKTKNHEVAIKKIAFDQLEDKLKVRAIKEISILQSINHPNIIKLYDYKFDRNKLLLITEYCNCGNMYEWINRENKQPQEILSVIKQILEGIQYLHSNKIIHRDIKPQNILIQEPLIIKICDFGFSQTFKEEINMFQTVCGTPLYMSPEILRMQQYTIKSEIWSLGVLFYNIFFNSHPYGELLSVNDYRSKLQTELNIPQITVFDNEDINQTINQLIKNMLSLEPDNRLNIQEIIYRLKIAENGPDTQFNFDDDYLKIDIINEKNQKHIVVENIGRTVSDIRYDMSPPSTSFLNSPMIQGLNESKSENIIFELEKDMGKGIFNNYFNGGESLENRTFSLAPPQSPPWNIPSPNQFIEPLKTIFSMMSSSIYKFK